MGSKKHNINLTLMEIYWTYELKENTIRAQVGKVELLKPQVDNSKLT